MKVKEWRSEFGYSNRKFRYMLRVKCLTYVSTRSKPYCFLEGTSALVLHVNRVLSDRKITKGTDLLLLQVPIQISKIQGKKKYLMISKRRQ